MTMFDFLRDRIRRDRVAKGLPPDPTPEELEAQRVADEARAAAWDERGRVEREARDAARAALGVRLGLDVPVTVAHAMRLSQLSANSSGSGVDAQGRHHVMLLAPWARGRMRRRQGEFLCRKGHPAFDVGDDGTDTDVTCPKCLAMLRRHAP